MTTVLWPLALLGLLGAFDTAYYHEWRARLPARGRAVASELKLHAARDFFYAAMFVTLPWLACRGWWVLLWRASFRRNHLHHGRLYCGGHGTKTVRRCLCGRAGNPQRNGHHLRRDDCLFDPHPVAMVARARRPRCSPQSCARLSALGAQPHGRRCFFLGLPRPVRGTGTSAWILAVAENPQ